MPVLKKRKFFVILFKKFVYFSSFSISRIEPIDDNQVYLSRQLVFRYLTSNERYIARQVCRAWQRWMPMGDIKKIEFHQFLSKIRKSHIEWEARIFSALETLFNIGLGVKLRTFYLVADSLQRKRENWVISKKSAEILRDECVNLQQLVFEYITFSVDALKVLCRFGNASLKKINLVHVSLKEQRKKAKKPFYVLSKWDCPGLLEASIKFNSDFSVLIAALPPSLKSLTIISTALYDNPSAGL